MTTTRRMAWAYVLALLLLPRASFAVSHDGYGFGIADDAAPAVLADANFQRLGVKVLRFQVPYDISAPQNAGIKAIVRQRIQTARNSGVEQFMISFRQKEGEWPSHGVWPSGQPTRPEPAAWAALVEPFVRELNGDVSLWGVANEPNVGLGWLKLDPTQHGADPCLAHGDGPQKLAGYYHALEGILAQLGSSAKLVGPEWQDEYAGETSNLRLATEFHPDTMESTLKHYIDHYRACGGGFGNFIGWHPYGGVRRQSLASTRDLLRAIPGTTPVLITEVGSILRGGVTPIDEIEQASQVSWIINELAYVDPRISRIYYYHVRGTMAPAWDSALEYPDGAPRASWYHYCRTNQNGRCDVPGVFPEGTFILTPNGTVYRSTGHSPVQLFTCNPQGYYPGCGNNFWRAPQEFVDNLRVIYPVPVDGTFIQRPDGAMFRFAGGAAVYLSRCPNGGCAGFVSLDGEAVNRLVARQSLPREGTLIRRTDDGAIFQMRCGRAQYVPDCNAIGGCAGWVDLDAAAVNGLAALPGCADDGNACTNEVCSAGECTHPFASRCLLPILSLLDDDDDGGGGGGGTCGDDCPPPAAGTPIAGTKLLIRDAADPRTRSITFNAKSPIIDGVDIDPVADGLSVQVYSDAAGGFACLHLPSTPGAWRATGTPPDVTYTYRDPLYANGPCAWAKLKRGSFALKCSAALSAIPYALDAQAQRSVAVDVTSGARTFCALMGGRVVADSGTNPPNVGGRGIFYAKSAPAPATCLVPPAPCP